MDWDHKKYEQEQQQIRLNLVSDGLKLSVSKGLIAELFNRWDALGTHKDDDFGEVQQVMEWIREELEQK